MSKQIHVGAVAVGGGAPVSIQSMCNTPTQDVERTVSQILRLEQAGCQIIRVAVPDMDAARAQVGKTYYFAKADAKLPEGRYFIDDLIGCTVLHADDGRTLGIVAKVDHPGVQDIYIVRDAAGEEHWIPAVPEFVVDVDIAARTVKMRPIAGMFDEPVNGDEE